MESSFLGFRLLISTLFLTLRADGLVIECRSSAWPESHRGDPRAQSVAMANRLLASLNHLTMVPPSQTRSCVAPSIICRLVHCNSRGILFGSWTVISLDAPLQSALCLQVFRLLLATGIGQAKKAFFLSLRFRVSCL